MREIPKRPGMWSAEEETVFQNGIETYCPGEEQGRCIGLGPGVAQMISDNIGTRSPAQVRSHAQKHFTRLRLARGEEEGSQQEQPVGHSPSSKSPLGKQPSSQAEQQLSTGHSPSSTSAVGQQEKASMANKQSSPAARTWSTEEKTAFQNAMETYCPGSRVGLGVGLGAGVAQKISESMGGTRSAKQVSNYAQKHFARLREDSKKSMTALGKQPMSMDALGKQPAPMAQQQHLFDSNDLQRAIAASLGQLYVPPSDQGAGRAPFHQAMKCK